MALREYQRKRDFTTSPEPAPITVKGGQHRFVVQKHSASRLHYDFRLEMDGVLKSWAVPKGVPYAKGEKRLAVKVEDHPVSYIDFEGTIPKGQYGGGSVMVWDKGNYEAETKSPLKDLEKGKLHFSLQGKKLHGNWHLVQLRQSDEWLLIKGGEDLKPVSGKQDDTSAKSGRTMAQISKNGEVWSSKPQSSKRGEEETRGSHAVKSKPSRFEFIEPMKAKLVANPPPGDERIYEIKFDGYRAEAHANGVEVGLLSLNQKDFRGKFPEVVDGMAALNLNDTIMDGEIVALNKQGVSSFQLLQAAEKGGPRPPIYFYAFDLLRLNGKELLNMPLMERKAALEKLLRNKPGSIRFSASLGSDATALMKQAQTLGLEGLIGKQKDSIYETGRRSGAWIKLKLSLEQEFVIGGYTNPKNSREHFGALILGFYEKGKLKCCGKSGTGFDQSQLEDLYSELSPIEQKDCPFVNLPETQAHRYSPGLTAAEMKHCHWVAPRLVCQIRFAEWTEDAKLRQAVFVGMRPDKDARTVVRETKA